MAPAEQRAGCGRKWVGRRGRRLLAGRQESRDGLWLNAGAAHGAAGAVGRRRRGRDARTGWRTLACWRGRGGGHGWAAFAPAVEISNFGLATTERPDHFRRNFHVPFESGGA